MDEKNAVKNRLLKLSFMEKEEVIKVTNIHPVYSCYMERMNRWADAVSEKLTMEELDSILQ